MHDNEEGGRYLDGIWGGYWGEEGDIHVDVRRADIMVKGVDSGGMSFIHDRKGDIDLAVRDVEIRVEGDRSVGIGGGQRHEGTGDIAIDVRDSTVVATGESVAGIRAFNFTGEGSIGIRVEGGTITSEGEGSSGILVGLTGRLFEDRPEPIGAPALRSVELPDSDDTRGATAAQDVVVNGRVRGGSGVGAGVRSTEAAGSRLAPRAASARPRALPCGLMGLREPSPCCVSSHSWTAAGRAMRSRARSGTTTAERLSWSTEWSCTTA